MSQHYQPRRSPRSGAIPDVIFILLIINGAVFAAQNLLDGPGIVSGPVGTYFALWPWGTGFREFYPWQLLTYGFLHGNITHILLNMVMLWMFGRELELIMGQKRFLIYFLSCVVGAGLVQLIVAGAQGGQYATVGASGGVFGVLLAFGMAFPNRMILLLIPPVPMKAKYLVILAGLMQLYYGVSGSDPGIANFAHLGGMLFGFLLLTYWKRNPRR